MFDVREYRPGGPTIKRFHETSTFKRFMAGPIGSGKTTGAGIAEMPFTAMLQKPMPDGVRRAKVGVLRDTYRNLYATFIPSWFRWFPRDLGHFVGSDDRPAVHTFNLETPVGPCELQVEMRALGPNTVEAVCRGWELSGVYLDEMDLMPPEAVSFLAGRVLRYPDAKYLNSRGVWGTFNKPDFDHWLYDLCEGDPAEDVAFFDQPGGLLDGGPPFVTNPNAENLENLPVGYYEIAAKGQPEWYVRRMIRNRWGASQSGQPIFPEFDRDRHVAMVEMDPAPRSELVLGLDGGGTPAAVIGGRLPNGRRVQYAEVVVGDPSDPKGRRIAHGVGPRRFAEAIGDTLALPRFRNCTVSIGYGDPAAFYGADREAGEYSFMETVGQILHVPIIPAPSNEIGLRVEAVRLPMARLNHFDGQPDLLINPSCRFTIRGLSGDYKWEAADPRQQGKRLKPQKTATSHVVEAGQYWLLGDQGRAGVTSGPAFDRHKPKAGTDLWTPASYQDAQRERAQNAPGQSYKTDFDLWG